MFSRLIAFSAALALSFPAFAEKSITYDIDAQTKDLFKCDEQLAAKHFSLKFDLLWIGLLNPAVDDQLTPYHNVMKKAETCADYRNAFGMLVEIAGKNGVQTEAHFAKPEVKAGLQQWVEVFRVINRAPVNK